MFARIVGNDLRIEMILLNIRKSIWKDNERKNNG